ncbi:hypothetical protein AB6A40_010195 [Gnathostoma spinigerum]|uniref:Metalloendopeptidase n=1 Tax=Gnathostoma spinigerum TaxID=75299 RepID=A0ABD6F0N5_9BILA
MPLVVVLLVVCSLLHHGATTNADIRELIDQTLPEGMTTLNATDFENAKTVNIDYDALGIKVSDLLRDDLFEGDIVLKDHQYSDRSARSAAVKNLQWPTNRVPYAISTWFGPKSRAMIAAAMSDFHRHTCIRFVGRTNEEDFVYIYPGEGCHSNLGHIGGFQSVSLGEGCFKKGIIIHELMHVLSFIHEQSRPDRDEYVIFHRDAVREGMQRQFERSRANEVYTLNVPYNYNSLMHYGPMAFSRNGRPTLTPRKSGADFMGQRVAFSKGDVEQVRRLYKCPPMKAYPEPNFKKLIEEDVKRSVQPLENCDDPWIRCEYPTCSDAYSKAQCPISCGILKCRTSRIQPLESCENPHIFCESPNCRHPYLRYLCPISCGLKGCYGY